MVAKSVIPPPAVTEDALARAQEALATIFGGKAPQLVATAKGVVVKGAPGTDGLDGKDGKDGTDGKDGKDAREPIDGKDGKDGLDGKDGKDGRNGRDGTDGKDGLNGGDGRDGKDAEPAVNGKDGINGKDGRDGTDGKDGADARDGKDGIDGKDGLNGTDGNDGRDGKDGSPGTFQPIHHTEFLTPGEWRARAGASQVRFVVIGGGEGGHDSRGGSPGLYLDTGWFPVSFLGDEPLAVEVGAGGAEGDPGGTSSIGRFRAHGGGAAPATIERTGWMTAVTNAPSGGGWPGYNPGANVMDPDALGGVDGWPGFGGSGGAPRQPGGLRGGGGGSNAKGGNGAVDVFEQ